MVEKKTTSILTQPLRPIPDNKLLVYSGWHNTDLYDVEVIDLENHEANASDHSAHCFKPAHVPQRANKAGSIGSFRLSGGRPMACGDFYNECYVYDREYGMNGG